MTDPWLVVGLGRWWYTSMMIAATAVAVVARRAVLRTRPDLRPTIDAERQLLIAAIGMAGAVVAAKGPFWIGWVAGSTDPSPPSVLTAGLPLSDGKTILWGLAGGYVGIELAKRIVGQRVATGDAWVVPVAAAVGVGRWGCFGWGCCFGRPTDLPWAVGFSMLPDGGAVGRHPTQLYESGFHLTFAAVAFLAIRRRRFADRWMMAYLIAYAVYRFISEFWRTEPVWYRGCTFYQASAVVLAAVMTLLCVVRTFRRRRTGRPPATS